MLRIDAYQHHGIFVVPEELLAYYPENYLPTLIWRSALFDALNVGEVRLAAVSDPLAAYVRTLRSSKHLIRGARKLSRLSYYTFHAWLQVAQLIPCFVAACFGLAMSKPEAISWFAEACGGQSAAFLAATGRLRQDWSSIWGQRGPNRLHPRAQSRYLKRRVVQYFGGPDTLTEGVRAVTRDAVAMARSSSQLA
jgi:hypothetical protein